MWGYTVFTVFPLNNKGKFCVGVNSFFPLIIREHFVWGYTVFPLNNKGKFCVGVHSFFPLYKECSSCVSNNPGTVFSFIIKGKNCMGYTVFPLNIRDELPNSVDLFEPSVVRWRNTVRSTLFLLICKVEKKRTTEFLTVFCAALSSQEAVFTLLHVTIYKEKKPVLIFFEKESTPSTLQMERECTVAFLHLMDEEKECTPPPQCFPPPYG